MFYPFIFLLRLHFSEQYLTSSQIFFHFFRHLNGRLQIGHVLDGKSDFFIKQYRPYQAH